jgi:hypothetical protein
VTGILGAVGPLVTAWFSSSSAERQERLALEKVRLDAELRRSEEAAKPKPLVDPAIMEMLGASARRAEESAKQFADLMRAQAEGSRINLESQGVAQRSMLQTIAQVMEIQAKVGDVKTPGIDWGKAVPAAIQGLAMLAKAQGSPVAGAGAAPEGTLKLPSRIPARGGLSPRPADPPLRGPGRVERLVKSKSPPSEVVEKLKKAFEDPAAQKEIEASGGPMGVFERRLGEWSQADANGIYAMALVKELREAKIIPEA